MLASPLRLKQRARFAQLLDTIACQPNVSNNDRRFGNACTRAAGVFGLLEIDALLVVFAHLLPTPSCASADAPTRRRGAATATAIVGDRASEAPPARLAVLDALQDVQNLARTCKFVAAALHAHGAAVRIEAAATWCTSLAPACRSPSASTTHDAFGQVLQEEKSRFDVRVLEAALKCMAVHCAGDHCRAARRVCNHESRVVAAHDDDEHGVQPPRRHPCRAARRPRVRVVMSAGSNVLRGAHIVLAAHPDRNECVLARRVDNGDPIIRLACYEATPPETLDPCSGLRRAWSMAAGPTAAFAVPSPPSSQSWRVQSVSASACGRWVALVRVTHFKANSDDVGCVVDLFRVDGHNNTEEGATAPHTQLALRCGRDLVLSAWFREQDLSRLDALDGVARRRATILCLCTHTFCDNGLAWSYQYVQWFPRASSPGINKVYQFALEDGAFARACARGVAPLPDNEGLLLRPQGVEVEMVREHHTETVGLDAASIPDASAQFCNRDGVSMPIAQSFAAETCMSSKNHGHECADSVGACLRGAVTIPAPGADADPDAGVVVCAVAQCVVLDLSYRHRNAGSDALLQPVMPMRSLAHHRPPTPEWVHLTPRGDVAVVMVRHAPPPSSGSDAFYVLHIVGRRGASARFAPLACLDLNRCLYNFLTQRALASSLLPTTATAGAPPPPPLPLSRPGRVHVHDAPRTCTLSPCGRFLLMAFDRRAVRGEHRHGTDSGVCVIDLSDIWDAARSRAAASAVAWIDCHADVLPMCMRWSRAGLWIDTRRGTLLLDSSATSSPPPPTAARKRA